MDNATAASGQTFVISRIFEAPRQLVFAAFTEPERMKHWWGPKGFTVLKVDMDFRPGGHCHYGLKAPDSSIMWGKFVYREISPPGRIVLINSFADEKGDVARHPGHEKWPLEMLTVFQFEELGQGKTKFTTTWTPHESTEEERATFAANHASMNQGWTGTLDQLAAYLATATRGK